MWQRRLDSDAERCCGGDRCHSGGYLLRIMPPSCILPPPASATASCRRNRSPLRQRRIESDTDLCRGGDCRRSHSSLPRRRKESDAEPRSRYGHCRRAIPHCSSEDATSIRKSGPEIKNRCTQEGVNRQNPASIRKSGLEIKNRCIGGVVVFCRRAIFSAATKIRIGRGGS